MRTSGLVFAIGLALAFSANVSDCFAETSATDQLRHDAQPQWESLRSEVLNLSGRIQETRRIAAQGDRPERVISRQIRYWLRGTASKFEIYRVPDEGTLTVYARNPRERFEIDRDDKRSPLHVRAYSPKSQSRSRVDEVLKFYSALPLAGFNVEQINLSDAIKEGRLTVKQISPKDASGRVATTLTVAIKGNGAKDYQIVFQPDHGWGISEWNTKTDDASSRGSLKYFDSVLGGRFPGTVAVEDMGKDGKLVARVEYQFDEPKPCDAPDEEFTLASYGLTPGGAIVTNQATSSWRWKLLALNATVIGVLFSVLWWRSYSGAKLYSNP
jgi:hypothetical protein